MRVSVIGAGGWGTTLAILLHNNGHEVILWEYFKGYAKTLKKSRVNKIYLPGITIPKGIDITHDLDKAALNRHILVVAVPSQFIRGVLRKIKKINFGNTTFVNVSKGIEKD